MIEKKMAKSTRRHFMRNRTTIFSVVSSYVYFCRFVIQPNIEFANDIYTEKKVLKKTFYREAKNLERCNYTVVLIAI